MRHLISGRCPRKRCRMTTQTTAQDAVGFGRGGRMSRQRKRDAVLRLLRGEDLETVSRSLGVTAATLTSWRDAFLAAGEAALASRPTDYIDQLTQLKEYKWFFLFDLGDLPKINSRLECNSASEDYS